MSSKSISKSQYGVGSVMSSNPDRKNTQSSMDVGSGPIPEISEVEQPSEELPGIMHAIVGEDTDELSDLTDQNQYVSRSTSMSRFGSWLSRIFPLIRNKKVRCLTIGNLILAFFNLIFIFILLVLLLQNVVFNLQIKRILTDQTLPCIYTYEPWSPCSASCWDGSSNYPQMTRFVNKSSIVQARGGDKPECPDDLHTRIDTAPCNTFRCPSNLSQYPFSPCYFKDAVQKAEGGCYRIRNVPLDDRLILIDANLTEDCSDEECDIADTYLF